MENYHNNDSVTVQAPQGIFAKISGAVVMLGFGSIGRGCLPLFERHLDFDRKRFVVIDPDESNRALLDERGIRFIKAQVTVDNYKELLTPLLTEGGGTGFCVNLSVDVSSHDVMRLCRDINAHYIDTVVEPWKGFYFDGSLDASDRSNYALREGVLREKARQPQGTTVVSCCGANPGMVSWFVKQALVDIATELKLEFTEPKTRAEWAKLMQRVGVKGIHIAERDLQKSSRQKPLGTFINTWSVEGFVAEGMQPAELGWGTHEKKMPPNGKRHNGGCQAAIYIMQPGANTRLRSWCPTPGAQYAFLVTHNEAISISDYYTVGSGEKPDYRPTCHYAYHPCDDAILSLDEMFGQAGKVQPQQRILEEDEIVSGRDELGVLLYGHGKNAYWYGSQLTIEQARILAPYQNATGLQVTSAVLAGMVWALENPQEGVVEADEMDYRRCLELQTPYLGTMKGCYTDWTPLDGRPGLFPEEIDAEDPWQFSNILVRS